jgi:GT2 family glycosyltransferase
VLYKERPDVVWAAGGRLTFRQNLSTLIGHRERDAPRFRETRPVDYVIGAVMLVKREVFDAIGLLDGSFFAYHEDLDFCVRASYEGFGVACVGEAAAHHAAGHSTGGGYSTRRKYMIGVNTVWFLRRHGTPSRWARFLLFDVLSLPFVFLVGLFRGRGRAVLAKGRGILDGVRGIRVTEASVAERR